MWRSTGPQPPKSGKLWFVIAMSALSSHHHIRHHFIPPHHHSPLVTHAMPPKTRKKAAAPKQAPATTLPNSRVHKCGPLNADETTTKPKAKKVKKTKNVPVDDNEAGNEKEGEEKCRKPARGKKTRCITPNCIAPHVLMV